MDDICIICYYSIYETPYCMLNSPHEVGKYHVECLEKWLTYNNIGILSQKPVLTYSIYHEDILLETINIIAEKKTKIKECTKRANNIKENKNENFCIIS